MLGDSQILLVRVFGCAGFVEFLAESLWQFVAQGGMFCHDLTESFLVMKRFSLWYYGCRKTFTAEAAYFLIFILKLRSRKTFMAGIVSTTSVFIQDLVPLKLASECGLSILKSCCLASYHDAKLI